MQRLFGTWLEETHDLQREAYGLDLRRLEGDAWAAEVRMNVTAIVAELGELLQELDWKPWANLRERPKGAQLGRARGEFVDVQHFMANLAVLLGLDDAVLSEMYELKMRRNRERQAKEGGYDGRSGKCPNCNRALDDVGTSESPADDDGIISVYCGGCTGVVRRFGVEERIG